MIDPTRNFVKVQVVGEHTETDTTIPLLAGELAKLPDPDMEGAFNMTYWNATDFPDPSDDPNVERVRITGKDLVANAVIVIRGQEGTTATAKNLPGKTYRMTIAFGRHDRDQLANLPRIASGWELIRTGTFTNNVNITELDGNADRLWMLVVRTHNVSPYTTFLRFNNDDTAGIYSFSRHASGTHGASLIHASWGGGGDSLIHLFMMWFLNQFSIITINPATGRRRMMTHLGSEMTDTFNSVSFLGEASWTNITDNIHTINILTGEITAGEFWLFRKRA